MSQTRVTNLTRDFVFNSAFEELEQLWMQDLVYSAREIDSRGERVERLLRWGACRKGWEKVLERLLRAQRQSRIHNGRNGNMARTAHSVNGVTTETLNATLQCRDMQKGRIQSVLRLGGILRHS